jgi:hypothetical protein
MPDLPLGAQVARFTRLRASGGDPDNNFVGWRRGTCEFLLLRKNVGAGTGLRVFSGKDS